MAAEVTTRKDRDRLRREEEFLDAAARVIARQGFHQTSMEDIAKEADYATGTIYRYFPSKVALYHQIILRKGDKYFRHMFDAVDQAEGPEEKLSMLVRGKLEFFSQHREFLRIYVADVSGGRVTSCDEDLPDDMKVMKEQYYRRMRDAFMSGMDSGVFRRTDVEWLISAVAGLTNELLTDWLARDEDLELARMENFIVELLKMGIGTGVREEAV